MPSNTNAALFLDRDGVINVNHGYVYKVDDFDWIEGIFSLVKEANDKGFKVIVLTNQSGIGRGFYSEKDFLSISNWMKAKFFEQACKIDDIYFCPHHPTAAKGEYLQNCDCRKPKSGMVTKAINEHKISASQSIMVGDKKSDMQAALNGHVGRRILFNDDKKQFSTYQTEQVSKLEQIVL